MEPKTSFTPGQGDTAESQHEQPRKVHLDIGGFNPRLMEYLIRKRGKVVKFEVIKCSDRTEHFECFPQHSRALSEDEQHQADYLLRKMASFEEAINKLVPAAEENTEVGQALRKERDCAQSELDSLLELTSWRLESCPNTVY